MSSRKWMVCYVTVRMEQIESIVDHGMDSNTPITVERARTHEEDTIRSSELPLPCLFTLRIKRLRKTCQTSLFQWMLSVLVVFGMESDA